MATVQKTASDALGNVAVFRYGSTPHVAVVTGQGYGVFYITESNFNGDYVQSREVSFSDPHLIGFLNF